MARLTRTKTALLVLVICPILHAQIGSTGGTANKTTTKGQTGATGPTGPTGSNGAAGATGLTGPTGSAGTNGSNGAVGATGPTGLTGPTGSAGTNGSNGALGATGPTGSAGTNGSNGAAGATGPTGLTGSTGSAGTNGSNGDVGAPGATGAAGSTLFSGLSGSATQAQLPSLDGFCTATPSAGTVTYTDSLSARCTGFNLGQLTAAVTSATFTGATGGKTYWWQIVQNSSTAYTVTWPSGFLKFPPMTPALGSTMIVRGMYDSTNSIMRFGGAWTDASFGSCPGGTVPLTAPTGGAYTYCDPTSSVPSATLPNGSTVSMQPQYYAVDSAASGTAYVAATSGTTPALAYVAGMIVRLNPNTQGTGGASTLNLDGLGAKSLFRSDCATNLTNAELLKNTFQEFWYNGSAFCEVRSPFPRLVAMAIPSSDTVSCNTTVGGNAYATTLSVPASYIGTNNKFRILESYSNVHGATVSASEAQYMSIGGVTATEILNATTGLANNTLNNSYQIFVTGTQAPGASQSVLFVPVGSAGSLSPANPLVGSVATSGALTVGFRYGCNTAQAGQSSQMMEVDIYQDNL
jgi:hypothetical protein